MLLVTFDQYFFRLCSCSLLSKYSIKLIEKCQEDRIFVFKITLKWFNDFSYYDKNNKEIKNSYPKNNNLKKPNQEIKI